MLAGIYSQPVQQLAGSRGRQCQQYVQQEAGSVVVEWKDLDAFMLH